MADIVEELGRHAKALMNAEHNSSDDVRKNLDTLRRFLVVTGELVDIYEYTLMQDLTHAANGSRRRAGAVTRPLRHSSMLIIAANRRIRAVWTQFQKTFAEELANARHGTRRDAFKFGG